MQIAEVDSYETEESLLNLEREGIYRTRLKIAQIQQLRLRVRELAQARRVKGTSTLADELSLTVFRLYEARFVLDLLVNKLKRLRQQRRRLMAASALPYGAHKAVL